MQTVFFRYLWPYLWRSWPGMSMNLQPYICIHKDGANFFVNKPRGSIQLYLYTQNLIQEVFLSCNISPFRHGIPCWGWGGQFFKKKCSQCPVGLCAAYLDSWVRQFSLILIVFTYWQRMACHRDLLWPMSALFFFFF